MEAKKTFPKKFWNTNVNPVVGYAIPVGHRKSTIVNPVSNALVRGDRFQTLQ